MLIDAKNKQTKKQTTNKMVAFPPLSSRTGVNNLLEPESYLMGKDFFVKF